MQLASSDAAAVLFFLEKEKEKNGGAKKGRQCPPLRILSQKEHPNAEHSLSFSCDYMQTNATVIDAMLKSYQGVIAASTGHISVHEAGAIEFGGHKVLTLPHHNGKIRADQIRTLLDEYQHDANHDHMVMPGMVYLSHPADPLSKWLCALLRFPDESGLLCHRERRDGAVGKAGGIRLLGSV